MLTTLSTEELIPVAHPIRRIRRVVEDVLGELDGEFEAMYSAKGRRGVPPEALLKAAVLMALYKIRSERAFCRPPVAWDHREVSSASSMGPPFRQ